MDKNQKPPSLLSELLAECLSDLDAGRDESQAAEETESAALVAEIVSNLEGFGSDREQSLVDRLKRAHELMQAAWEMQIDDHYSRELVSKIPHLVGRFRRLAPVLAGKSKDPALVVYLREASRCYLYGFPQATIAICRAALESGLNSALERQLGSIPVQKLSEKIDQAARFNLLRPETAHFMREIVRTGNAVLHDEPASDETAFTTLALTRKILADL